MIVFSLEKKYIEGDDGTWQHRTLGAWLCSLNKASSCLGKHSGAETV